MCYFKILLMMKKKLFLETTEEKNFLLSMIDKKVNIYISYNHILISCYFLKVKSHIISIAESNKHLILLKQWCHKAGRKRTTFVKKRYTPQNCNIWGDFYHRFLYACGSGWWVAIILCIPKCLEDWVAIWESLSALVVGG